MQADTEVSITTTYCNEDEKKEEFEDTRLARLTARDRFFDLRAEAERNMTVFEKFPHIVMLRFVQPEIKDDPVIEEFPCRCSKHQEEVGT